MTVTEYNTQYCVVTNTQIYHGGNNTVSHTQDTIHSTTQSYSGKSSLQKISKILSPNLTFTKDIVFTLTHVLLNSAYMIGRCLNVYLIISNASFVKLLIDEYVNAVYETC